MDVRVCVCVRDQSYACERERVKKIKKREILLSDIHYIPLYV